MPNIKTKSRPGIWIVKTCPSCGQEFTVLKSKQTKYCSQKCNQERNEKYMNYNCDSCGKEIRIKKDRYQNLLDGKVKHITCSKECSYKLKETGTIISCTNCGKEFYRRGYHINKQENQFCCSKCNFEYKRKQAYEIKKCEICGTEFECYKKSTQRFCSHQCNNEWLKTRVGVLNSQFTQKLIKCDYCGSEFYIKPSQLENGTINHFCSTECRQSWFREVYSQQPDYKQKVRERILKEFESGAIGKTQSKPQQITDDILTNLNIQFEREKNIKYYAIDNYLTDYNLMIEVQGDYWHCNPTIFTDKMRKNQFDRISKDKSKHTYVKNKYNIEILYLWEDDLYKNEELCKKLIQLYIRNKGILLNYNSFNYHLNEDNTMSINSEIIIPYQNRKVNTYKQFVIQNN